MRITLKHWLLGFGALFFFIIFFSFQNSPSSQNDPASYLIRDGSRAISALFRNSKGEKAAAYGLTSFAGASMWLNVPYDENGEEKTMKLYLMATTTDPPFVATLADPQQEAASADVYQNGDMEIPTRKLFQHILQHKCTKDQIVVDAGANLGYFSTYSAVLGCSVRSFEPQPRLLPIIQSSWKINGVDDRTQLFNNILSENFNEKLGIVYVESMCWGCSRVVPVGSAGTNEKQFVITSTRIDKHVDEDVLLMKVDVEGFEVKAIQSASKIFRKHKVQNMIIEWSAKRWPHPIADGDRLLEKLYDTGFTIRHYDLRMTLPVPDIANPEESFPIIGRAWEVPRENLAKMNEFLHTKDAYGEANLWLRLERPPSKPLAEIWKD